MWRLTILLAALALGGCNMVVSSTPWFTAAEESGAPHLREGLWANPEAGCAFKDTDPADQWPDCANGLILGDHKMTPLGQKASQAGASVLTYVLGAGPPPIWQMRLTPSDALPIAAGDFPQYLYVAFSPKRTDPDGRVTAFSSWLVQCGPLEGTGDKAETLTHAPFPGLVVGKLNCTAKTRDDLLNAARLSKDLPPQAAGETRWIRDGAK